MSGLGVIDLFDQWSGFEVFLCGREPSFGLLLEFCFSHIPMLSVFLICLAFF